MGSIELNVLMAILDYALVTYHFAAQTLSFLPVGEEPLNEYIYRYEQNRTSPHPGAECVSIGPFPPQTFMIFLTNMKEIAYEGDRN
jgi:hypothetical protein